MSPLPLRDRCESALFDEALAFGLTACDCCRHDNNALFGWGGEAESGRVCRGVDRSSEGRFVSGPVAQISWASPVWADDARVRVAAAIWVIETNGRRIVADPALTADEILRS